MVESGVPTHRGGRPLQPVLSIDAGLVSGWALCQDGQEPQSGSHEIPEFKTLGGTLDYFDEWLADLIVSKKPGALVFAAPFVGPRRLAYVMRPLFGYSALIELAGLRRNIPTYEIAEGEARKAIVGWPKLEKGLSRTERERQFKQFFVDGCKALGWRVTDHHAADALIIGAYAVELLKPVRRVAQNPTTRSKRAGRKTVDVDTVNRPA